MSDSTTPEPTPTPVAVALEAPPKRSRLPLAALIVGITMLTMPLWVGSSHTYEGTDWTGVLQPGLSIVGLAFTAGGLGVFLKALAAVIRQPEPAILAHEVRP